MCKPATSVHVHNLILSNENQEVNKNGPFYKVNRIFLLGNTTFPPYTRGTVLTPLMNIIINPLND